MTTIDLVQPTVTDTLERLRAHLLTKNGRAACYTTFDLTGGLIYEIASNRWQDQAMTVEFRGERYNAALVNQTLYINKDGTLFSMSVEKPEFRAVNDTVIENGIQRLLSVSLLLV